MPRVERKKVPAKKLKKQDPDPEPESESETDSTWCTEDCENEDDTSTTLYTEDDDDDMDVEDESPKFDMKKFGKLLASTFPSKYAESKYGPVEKTPKSKSAKPDAPKLENRIVVKPSKKEATTADATEKKKKTKPEYEDLFESSSDTGSESRISNMSSGVVKKDYGITLIIGGDKQEGDEEEYYENSEEEDADRIEDGEENECDSDDEKTFMKETYQKIDVDAPVSPSSSKKSQETLADISPNKKQKTNKHGSNDGDDLKLVDIEKEYLDLLDLKRQFVQQLTEKPGNKILEKSIQECKSSIRALVKQTRYHNTKTYHKLVYKSNQKPNEMEYFKNKLSNKEQLKIVADLKEINKHMYFDKPYRLSLLQSSIPPRFKSIAMQKLNMLKSMDPSNSEYYKIKNWVDTFMKIPFGIYRNVSVSINDGVDVCDGFLQNAKKTLDDCVYGLDDAKLQIMQMIGQWMVNPSAMGTAIAIHGPPGTGKTSIVKDGISKILGREFSFIALGGGGDASFLEGHSYTYEGSTWGKIVQILVESKCMNPVIYFDELDKVSDTARGQEIVGILTHLTDTTQNSQYHDKYFSEIDFDLSKCLFIFSYNEEQAVNPILKDRMYRIKTKGYGTKEKITIAKKYMLPKIREQVSFVEGDVIIPDDTLEYIINSSVLTKNESGVRNLKRCLEIIHTKLNLFRLISPDNKMFETEIKSDVKFPYTVSRRDVDLFVRSDEPANMSFLSMYV